MASFRGVPLGVYVDATLGGGGHAEAVLRAHPGLRLLGLDQDPDALAAASRRLSPFGARIVTVHTRFDRLHAAMHARHPDTSASAVLFDLGVSSPQLDRPERGFSYNADGPLDMRMDPTNTTLTAADVVNGYPVDQLARTLREHSDERFADRIARAIERRRPISGTAELAEVVREAIPAATRRHGGHPAKRTFQAIRVEVNDERHALAAGLDQALDELMAGGRCAVLSYHSGEDRHVKRTFAAAVKGDCACPPYLPCDCGAVPRFALVRSGPKKPSAAEVEQNRRASSARLRVIERLHTDDPGLGRAS